MGWGLITLLNALPIASFHALTWPALGVIGTTVIVGFAACALTEARCSRSVIDVRDHVRNTSDGHFWICIAFSALAFLGALLVLADQNALRSLVEFGELQQRYVGIINASKTDEASGTRLSTFGNVLRSCQFVALASFVAYTAVRRPPFALFLLFSVLSISLWANFITYVSRVYLIFCILVMVLSGHTIRSRVLGGKTALAIVAVLGAVFLVVTNTSRYEIMYADVEAADYLAYFFDADYEVLGEAILSKFGVGAIAVLLYLSHSLAELAGLLQEQSPYALGTHSFYLILIPTLRLLGISPPLMIDQTDRQGMWWSVLGDLYIDWGFGFIVLYPLLVTGIVWIAYRLEARSSTGFATWSFSLALLFSSPFFGVLNTFSFAYLMVLVISFLSRLRWHRAAVQAT